MQSLSNLSPLRALLAILCVLATPIRSMQIVREIVRRATAQSTEVTRVIDSAVVGSAILTYLEHQRDMRDVDNHSDLLTIRSGNVEDHIRTELKSLGVPFWRECLIGGSNRWSSLSTHKTLILFVPEQEMSARLRSSDSSPIAHVHRAALAHEAGHLYERHTLCLNVFDWCSLPVLHAMTSLTLSTMMIRSPASALASASVAYAGKRVGLPCYRRYLELKADEYIPDDPALLKQTAVYFSKAFPNDSSWMATHPLSELRAERLLERARMVESSGSSKRRATFDPEAQL